MRFLTLFFLDARIKMQRSIAYRSNFLIGLFVSVGYSMIGPLFQYLIFTNTRGYPGWNLSQIVLFQGVVLTYTGLKGCLFGNVPDNIQSMVWRGDFDRLLVKPYEPVLLILSGGFNLADIGTLASGLIVMIASAAVMHLAFSLLSVGILLVSLVCGLIFYAGFEILYCTLLIMLVNNSRIQDLIGALFNFTGYPAEIFPKAARVVMMTVLPFLTVAWFPARALLGQVTLLALPGLAFCILLPYLALRLWRRMLVRYTSAGG